MGAELVGRTAPQATLCKPLMLAASLKVRVPLCSVGEGVEGRQGAAPCTQVKL